MSSTGCELHQAITALRQADNNVPRAISIANRATNRSGDGRVTPSSWTTRAVRWAMRWKLVIVAAAAIGFANHKLGGKLQFDQFYAMHRPYSALGGWGWSGTSNSFTDLVLFSVARQSNVWFAGTCGKWLELPSELPRDVEAVPAVQAISVLVWGLWYLLPEGFMQRHFILSAGDLYISN